MDLDWVIIEDSVPPEIIEKIYTVAKEFPELSGCEVHYRCKNQHIWMSGDYQPHQRTDNSPKGKYWGTVTLYGENGNKLYVIGHENNHAVQYQKHLIPYGERSCEIYTMAKSINIQDRKPSYLDINPYIKEHWNDFKMVAHNLAIEAIKKREQGERKYIKWWESSMYNMCEKGYIEKALLNYGQKV